MSLAILLTLAGLALIDSTSIGTIGVPIALVVARTPLPRQLLYLATIASFYFLVGIALLLGLDAVVGVVGDRLGDLLSDRAAALLWLAIGAALIIISYKIDPARRKNRPERKWLPRNQSAKAMVVLALTAGLLEIAAMVPYLTAIGILTSADISLGQRILSLAGYSLVMTLPALGLLFLARVADRWLSPWLARFSRWLSRQADGMLSWGVGIVGVVIILNAIGDAVDSF